MRIGFLLLRGLGVLPGLCQVYVQARFKLRFALLLEGCLEVLDRLVHMAPFGEGWALHLSQSVLFSQEYAPADEGNHSKGQDRYCKLAPHLFPPRDRLPTISRNAP